MDGIRFVWGFKYTGSVCIYSVIYESYLKRPEILRDNIFDFNFVQQKISELNRMSAEEFESLKTVFFLCKFKKELKDGKRTGTFYLLPIEGGKSWRYILPQCVALEPLKIDKLIGKFCPN
ncbi:MAG: hypothetical protein WC933_02540 [Candidatus Paceibacterota bacterium]|jgi:hypothetical protein